MAPAPAATDTAVRTSATASTAATSRPPSTWRSEAARPTTRSRVPAIPDDPDTRDCRDRPEDTRADAGALRPRGRATEVPNREWRAGLPGDRSRTGCLQLAEESRAPRRP